MRHAYILASNLYKLWSNHQLAASMQLFLKILNSLFLASFNLLFFLLAMVDLLKFWRLYVLTKPLRLRFQQWLRLSSFYFLFLWEVYMQGLLKVWRSNLYNMLLLKYELWTCSFVHGVELYSSKTILLVKWQLCLGIINICYLKLIENSLCQQLDISY